MKAHLDIVEKRFEGDKYARELGIVLDELTQTTVQMRMPLREDMRNWFGRIHGGAIYSLADAAFSVLTNNDNNLSVALECSITYHASADPASVLCVRGETLAKTQKTASYLFKIYGEDKDSRTLVATMKSLSYRTGKPIETESAAA